jgi:hypothetical protein
MQRRREDTDLSTDIIYLLVVTPEKPCGNYNQKIIGAYNDKFQAEKALNHQKIREIEIYLNGAFGPAYESHFKFTSAPHLSEDFNKDNEYFARINKFCTKYTRWEIKKDAEENINNHYVLESELVKDKESIDAVFEEVFSINVEKNWRVKLEIKEVPFNHIKDNS